MFFTLPSTGSGQEQILRVGPPACGVYRDHAVAMGQFILERVVKSEWLQGGLGAMFDPADNSVEMGRTAEIGSTKFVSLNFVVAQRLVAGCLLYTSPSPR